MNDMIRQRAELNEKIAKMNLQNATLETDFSNPTVFDVAKMKEKQKSEGEKCKKWRCVYATYFDKSLSIK